MGNFQEARTLLSNSIKHPNLKLQGNVRPYLAMTCHRLGDEKKAQHYLQGAEQSVTKLEAEAIDYFWHERLLSQLVLEEARQLIEGGE